MGVYGKAKEKGVREGVSFLRGEEVAYVDCLVEWVNRDGAGVGAERVEGHSREWHEANTRGLGWWGRS